MANKKKTTTITEEEVPAYEDIHEKTMQELAEDKVEEKEEVREPEKPVEEVKEEVRTEPVPQFDPEQLKREAAEAATNALLERLTGVKEKKNEGDEELTSPWAKEGRTPKDYEEIADWAVSKKQILDDRRAKEVEANTKEAREASEKVEREREQGFLTFVDEELKELYEEGRLPKIKDANNPNDPGVVATNSLLQTMATVNAERNTKGQPLIYSINKIFHSHYKAPNRQPAGADAPVSGSRGASSNEADDTTFVYARDHKKTFQQLGGN